MALRCGLTPSHRVFVVCLLLLTLDKISASCDVNSPVGACNGPADRTSANRRQIDVTNSNCPLSKVPYYKDNDPTTFLCGNCLPGTASSTDEFYNSCALNEFCNDDGECQPLINSPFYDQDCPYEPGVTGFCGPGLKCVLHKCVICVEGEIDLSDGRMCFGKRWTYDRWATIAYDPAATFLILNFVVEILLGAATMWFVYQIYKLKKLQVQKNAQELANLNPRDN